MGRPAFSLRSRRPLVGLGSRHRARRRGTRRRDARGSQPPARHPGIPARPRRGHPGDKDGFGTAIRQSAEQGLVHAEQRHAQRDLLPAHRHRGHPRHPVRRVRRATFTDREDAATTSAPSWSIRARSCTGRSTPPPAASTASPRPTSPTRLARRCWSTCGSSRSPASRTSCTSCTTSASG